MPVTPSAWRTLLSYASGKGKTSEIALRMIRRVLEAASAPAYQALITVCKKPNASVASVLPCYRVLHRLEQQLQGQGV